MSKKPNIKIKGNIQDMKKKEKNIKPKHSNFLLTINTNQQYKDDDVHLQDDIEIFDESIKTIFNNIDQYINLPETDKWDDDFIKDVDVKKKTLCGPSLFQWLEEPGRLSQLFHWI